MVEPSQVVEECDRVGVSQRGYRALSELWFKNFKNQQIKPFGLPRSHKVMNIQNEMNHKVPNYFGEYYHIEGSMPYEK